MSTKSRHRKPWLAALLSLLSGGLGQLYNGQFKKAILFFLLGLSIPQFMGFVPAPSLPLFFLLVFGSFFIYKIWAIRDAYKSAWRLGSHEYRWFSKWYCVLGAGLVLLFLSMSLRPWLMEQYVTQSFNIVGPAMEPTVLNGDRVIVDMRRLDKESFQRGDIVVVKIEKTDSLQYFSRLVAFEGETLELRDGVLMINDEIADASMQGVWTDSTQSAGNFGPVKIPPSSYFLLGDNRSNSLDSRMYGSVQEILGRLRFVFFSWDPVKNEPRYLRIGKSFE